MAVHALGGGGEGGASEKLAGFQTRKANKNFM